MGLAVADFPHLASQALLRARQQVSERIPARYRPSGDVLGQHPQTVLRVDRVVLLVASGTLAGVFGGQQHRPTLTRGNFVASCAGDERVQRFAEQFQGSADAFAVTGRHLAIPPRSRWSIERVVTLLLRLLRRFRSTLFPMR